jgi:phospho-N-acetylmuramoyl-pentapeptide-transferase
VIAIILAGASSMLVSLFGTRYLIIFFRQRGQGQPILGKEDHGPEHHMLKQGTPTMGGIAIVGAALIGWLVAHLRRGLAFSDQTMIVWVGVLFMALMGFLDDYIKVRKHHNRGIFWKQKNYITMLASIALAWWLVVGTGISETINVTRGAAGIEVPTVVWVVWAGMIIWATTNAVNVTDGLLSWASAHSRSSPIGRSATRRSTPRSSTRSTWASSQRPSPADVSGSSGGTPPRRASSWGTSARSRSVLPSRSVR